MNKTRLKGCFVTLLGCAFILGTTGESAAAEDLNKVFQAGKAAFYRGDMQTANRLLSQVEAAQPSHFETRALLAQVRLALREAQGMNVLRKTYEAVTLGKIEFVDVTFDEALEGLRGLSRNATGGKVVPNFIVQDPTLNSKTVTLQLNALPLSEAISYLARVAGCRMTYEKHAVIFSSMAAPAPGAEAGGATPPVGAAPGAN